MANSLGANSPCDCSPCANSPCDCSDDALGLAKTVRAQHLPSTMVMLDTVFPRGVMLID